MGNIENIVGQLHNHGLEDELKENRYYKFISQVQQYIHSQIPDQDFDTAKVATKTNIRREIFQGKEYQRAVIFLMTNGCEWALKSGHGCTMCGHLGKQAIRHEPIPTGDFIRQFSEEFEVIDFKQNPLLNLYNNGSFLNDREIPGTARAEILKMINKNPDIKMLVLETRPEFVTEEKVKEIKRLVPDKHVELAIGLELKDDRVRRICINKGFSLNVYNRATEIITRHLNLRTYIFLKPPVLTEKESIQHAVETITHAFARGACTVSLEACTVQDFTLTKYLYDMELYNPPYIWSIIEVVKQCKQLNLTGKLIVGLFQFYPSPNKIPYNCEQCSDRAIQALIHYNRTLDANAFDGLNCQCKKQWEDLLKKEPLPFETRLEQMVEQLKDTIKK